MPGDPKTKSRKKPKKAKFKSLKKESLASELKLAKEESSPEPMSMDGEIICREVVTSSEIVSPISSVLKKRKNTDSALNVEEGKTLKKRSRKLKKPLTEQRASDLDSKLSGMQHNERLYSSPCDGLADIEQKPAGRS